VSTFRGRPGRGGRGFGGRGTRSPTAWAGFAFNAVTVAGGNSLFLGAFTPLPGFSHETVVRTVGRIGVLGLAAGATGALGLAVVSDAAVTAGVTAMPKPITDINDDLWNVYIPVALGGTAQESISFDQRAMRKVEEGQQLAVIVEAGLVGFILEGVFRVLSKVAVRA